MLDTRLIIVTGISGTGKSTTAKWLSSVLQKNGIKINYLHEECENHPIRSDEFSHGALTSEADMDINCGLMLDRWAAFRDTVLSSDQPVLLEACLYENIVRYFFECNYPQAKILKFYDDLMDLLAPLAPAIIHLRTSDVYRTFQRVFPIRGDWWRKLILEDRCKYFVEHGYSGEEGNYQLARDYQNLAIMAYDRFEGSKYSLDTLKEEWDVYHQEICHFLEISFFPEKQVPIESPQDYVGQYEVIIDNRSQGFRIGYRDGTLFCQSFWPYMALNYEGDDRFSFLSFPIELQFVRKKGQIRSVLVSGNYDWGLCGRELMRA